MDYFIVNQQGRKNIHFGTPCEDCVAFSREYNVFCLADGVSNSVYGGEGASVRVQDMEEWLSSLDVRKQLHTLPLKELRPILWAKFCDIRVKLTAAYPGSEPSSFASTFLAAVDVSPSTLCLIHCGDGMIFGVPNAKEARPTILSMPDNHELGMVYDVDHPDQAARMRILRIKKEDYSCVLLGTDGFTDAYFRYPYTSNLDGLENLLFCQGEEEFQDLLAKQHTETSDDISCILLAIHPEREILQWIHSDPKLYPVKRQETPKQTPASNCSKNKTPEQDKTEDPATKTPPNLRKTAQSNDNRRQASRAKRYVLQGGNIKVRFELISRAVLVGLLLFVLGLSIAFITKAWIQLRECQEEDRALQSHIEAVESRLNELESRLEGGIGSVKNFSHF